MSSKVEEYGLPAAAGRIAQNRYEGLNGNHELGDIDIAIARRTAAVYRPAYLSEDDTVIACCHHAHEVARAHGAKEVMLEHLVHAMARVGTAASILEERGINVDGLRRESAAVIASEIAVESAIERGQLRASKEFNTVMFLAAAAASQRDERATGVRDVLEALFHHDPKARAVRLIRKHAAGASWDEPTDPLAEVRSTMDRYAAEVRELRLAVADLRTTHVNQVNATHGMVDHRIAALEKVIGTLAGEINADRVNGSDRMLGLIDAVAAQRSDAASLQRLIGERLMHVEQLIGTAGGGGTRELQTLVSDRFHLMQKGFEAQRLDAQRLEAGLVEKLKLFEKAIEAQNAAAAQSTKALADRLTAMEQASALATKTLGDKLTAIEQAAARTSASGGVDLQPLIAEQAKAAALIDAKLLERLKAVEVSLGERLNVIDARYLEIAKNDGPLNERFRPISDKLTALGQSVTAQRDEIASINESLDSELDQIRKALVALGHAQQTLSTAIDEWRLNNSGDLSIISNRLETLEKSTLMASAPRLVQPPANGQLQPVGLPNPSLLDRVDRALKGRAGSQS